MFHNHQHGKPRSILKINDTKEAVIDSENLNKIFDFPEIQDRKVVILSLIGVFRGGKSFFLDYCLRYLYAHFPSINNKWGVKALPFQVNKNWIGSADEPLQGFSWQSGTKRDTIGIIMWSDVFLHTIDETNEKIAIFVMDTQGLFDNESTPADNSRIFSLGTLISSIQVLNVLNRIQEDQLQYLQFAAEFTKFTALKSKNLGEKPFQNLTFIIRDWNNSDDYKYGMAGGRSYVYNILQTKPGQKTVLKSVRDSIFNCFGKIECCLLPYPGKAVANSKAYNGNWMEMDYDFRNPFFGAIETILHPENLIPKRVNSNDIKVSEMKNLIMSYLESFQSNEEINVLSIYELTVENQTASLIKKCINEYKGIFNEVKNFFTDVDKINELSKQHTLEYFYNQNKMGTDNEIEIIREKLDAEMEITFQYLKNDTPSFLFVFYSRLFLRERLRKYTSILRRPQWTIFSKKSSHNQPNKDKTTNSEIVPEHILSKEKHNKQPTEEVVRPIISWALVLIVIGVLITVVTGITVIVKFIGLPGVLSILTVTFGWIIFKMYINGIEIPDAIACASKIVTEISQSITNAATSLTGAANASASAMSAVKRVKDVFN